MQTSQSSKVLEEAEVKDEDIQDGVFVIREEVTSIGHYAFYQRKRLSGIVIPASVTDIGSCAFSGCTELKRIIIDVTTSEEYERIKKLLPKELRSCARSKWQDFVAQNILSILKSYNTSSSYLLSSQGRLNSYRDLVYMISDFAQFPENKNSLLLKEELCAAAPFSFWGNRGEWAQYEEKLKTIGREWEQKFKESIDEKSKTRSDEMTAYHLLQACQQHLRNINTPLYKLLGSLSSALIVEKIRRLDQGEKALLKTQKTLLKKIPVSILSRWN